VGVGVDDHICVGLMERIGERSRKRGLYRSWGRDRAKES
jgi:hypothetical protein